LRQANLLANFFSIWNFFLGGITADWIFILILLFTIL
jgi:hypothetical protein